MATSLVILTFVFFIKDVLQRENIDLKHCQTERMIADFYTKPLQGVLFIKMTNFIMGLDDAFCEERVEKRDNSDKPSPDILSPDKSSRAQNTPQYKNDVEIIRSKPTYAEIVKQAKIK